MNSTESKTRSGVHFLSDSPEVKALFDEAVSLCKQRDSNHCTQSEREVIESKLLDLNQRINRQIALDKQ